MLHEVVWGVVGGDALEGAAGGGLAVVSADEGAGTVTVLGLMAAVEEEG